MKGPEADVRKQRKLYVDALEATIGAAICSGNEAGASEWVTRVMGHLMQPHADEAQHYAETTRNGPLGLRPDDSGRTCALAATTPRSVRQLPGRESSQPLRKANLLETAAPAHHPILGKPRPPNSAKQILLAECKAAGAQYAFTHE